MAKDDLSVWKNRKSVADRKFKKEAEKNIKKYRKYYRGDQWAGGGDGMSIDSYKDKPVDNMIFSNIKTIMPSVNFQNPKIFVQARKKPYKIKDGIFDTISASVIFEILLNYHYRILETKRQVDKCLLDALLGPWGIMQLGYTLETEKFKDDELLETNELLKSESPFAIRVSPLDFRSDPEAKDSHLEDAKWIAFKWVKTLDAVKVNPKYKNTDKLKSNVRMEFEYKEEGAAMTGGGDMRGISSGDDYKRVEGWDIWDKDNHRLITLVDGHNKFIQDTDWPLEFSGGNGFPVETLYFNENPDELYPVSDVEIYLPAQDMLNRMNSMFLDHVRRISQRRYLAKEGALTAEEMRKLTHGPDGTVISTTLNPENIQLLKDATVSQDLYMSIRQLKESIRENSGIPMFEKGIGQKFDTATEPALMAQGMNSTKAARTAIVEDFVVHVVTKLGKILQQTMPAMSVPLSNEQFKLAQQFTQSKLEKITGQQGAMILQPWLNADKEDIQGDYDFTIEVGSTQPHNPETRKRDSVMLFNLMKDNPMVDGIEGTRRVLEAFEQSDIDKLMRDPKVVAQERQQNTQMAIQTEQAKDAPKRETDLQKTKMKSDTNILTTMLKTGHGGGKEGGVK